jgi:hypothetical protein
MEASPMLDLFWLLLASIPFVTGITFVVLGYRERAQSPVARDRTEETDRR